MVATCLQPQILRRVLYNFTALESEGIQKYTKKGLDFFGPFLGNAKKDEEKKEF